MTALGQRIAALIAAQGPISIAEFMTAALHDPQAGYYATRDPFGAAGDFITAPEISQVFGELVGLWCAQAWHDQGKPARPRLVELGPGRGTLMRDALRAMKLMPEFRDQLEVVLVEMSPALRKVQETTLKDCGVTVRWAESFGAIAADRPTCSSSPTSSSTRCRSGNMCGPRRGWCERMVTADADGALSFVLAPVPLPSRGTFRPTATARRWAASTKCRRPARRWPRQIAHVDRGQRRRGADRGLWL